LAVIPGESRGFVQRGCEEDRGVEAGGKGVSDADEEGGVRTFYIFDK